jgi:hypothetical protein
MSSLDQFGGDPELGRFEKTGRFRLVRTGPRHLFASPEGHGFWLKACYGVDITDGGQTFVDALHAKYGTDPTYPVWGYWFAFTAQAVRYLRHYGFNALGEYTSNYAMPFDTNNRGRGNSEKMPFIGIANTAHYGKVKYGVKDVMHGVDTSVTPGLWRVEGFPDVFDPAFAKAADALIGAVDNPWLIAMTTDDRDYLFGFGPTREFNGWHNHLGWQAAASRPTQETNPRFKATYTDKTVYTKLAFRDFLRAKYRSLEQLNAAWGSAYDTWESDGRAWPTGKGVLDESGRSPWLGRDFYLAKDARPNVRADLDAFVGAIADKYFSVVVGTLRRKAPNHLVFGPATISPGAHAEILKAAGKWCDAVQFSQEGVAAFRRGFSLARKPFFVWTTFMSQADSPLAGRKGWEGFDLPSQTDRGRAYAEFIRQLVAFQGDDGSYPCVGIDWWAYCDKVTGGEANNFGLVTTRDNPYDGRAARRARGKDAWGNPTGGEGGDYGDFLGAVKAANESVVERARASSAGPRRSRTAAAPAARGLTELAVLLGTLAGSLNVRLDRRTLLLGAFARREDGRLGSAAAEHRPRAAERHTWLR